jgi:choline kinase
MKAIILAAGRGSRMQHLTDEHPKCLVHVKGKSLLDWQLEALRKAGIEEIAIVTGYKHELLSHKGLVEFHNPRWAQTNMVTSLTTAHEWLANQHCIVSYSDIFYEASAITSLINSHAAIAITFDPHWKTLWEKRFTDVLIDAETFKLHPDNTLAEIGNKPLSITEIQGQYMGLLKFTPTGWGVLQDIRTKLSSTECDRIHMTGILQKIIEQGYVRISAVPYQRAWGEVDTESDLLSYS